MRVAREGVGVKVAAGWETEGGDDVEAEGDEPWAGEGELW